jgi:peptidoglycan/xylan/chitin deacetylase (PgdA/CDA1 family)
VLLYHELVDGPGGPGCVSLDTFDAHMTALERAGFRFVSLREAFRMACAKAAGSQRLAAPAPALAVTFDDGYAGVARVLGRYATRLQPTAFLVPTYLGRSNLVWNPRAGRIFRHMTLAQARALARAGVALEAHGIDHHNLLKFDADQLRRRFARLRRWFAENLGQPAQYLAYPYGACSRTVARVAQEFFAGALSVNDGHWQGRPARYALNRVNVQWYLDGSDLLEVLRLPGPARWAAIGQRAPRAA